MRVNVYFGSEGLPVKHFYIDDRTPMNQINTIEKLKLKDEEFNILTYSPYVLETIDAVFDKNKVRYFNNGVESNLISILSEISKAFYRIKELEEINNFACGNQK